MGLIYEVQVRSSFIRKIGYTFSSAGLEIHITMEPRRTYVYLATDYWHWTGLVAARSKGKFYNAVFKGKVGRVGRY